MTPAEYLELTGIASSNAGQHGSNVVATLFAYIIAAYFVGYKLSRFQVVSITILYTVYFTIPVFATLGEQTRLLRLFERFAE